MKRREQIARELVDWHFEVEPMLTEVYVFIGEGEDPIRLLEVNEGTLRNDRFEAYVFAPTKNVPYRTAIAEVTPDELVRLQQTPGALPPEWNLDRAEIFRRPEAA